MSQLLSEAAENADNYEPKESERHAGNHSKRIVTLFGETSPIKRTYWYDEETHKGHFPFDEKLGLIGRYTPAASADMVRCAVDHPFADAAKEFSSKHAFKISADTIRDIVKKQYKTVLKFAKENNSSKEDNDKQIPLACIVADGTGIPLRKKSLQGAKGKNGKAKTREVKAGAIFLASNTSENEPHRNVDTTSYVATTYRAEKFGRILRDEFDRRFGKLPETTLYITDGGKWLQTIQKNHFSFAIPVLDIYHALEHLTPLMLGLGFKENTKNWKYYYKRWSKFIKEGKTKKMLDYILKNLNDKLRGDAKREYKYYENNLDRMKYDEYRKNGWFIGSGVIESGCKNVIGKRFKQSGMMWSLKGAKSLLPLRTLYKSERLEEFFRFSIKDLQQVDCAL